MIRASHRTVSGFPAAIGRFLRRFRGESGAVAIWFAVMALPMAVMAFGLVDLNRASVEKRHLQDALDAATLLVARSTVTTDSAAQTMGGGALAAQLTGMGDATLASSSFKIVGTRIVSTATASVVPVIANLWLQGDMIVGAEAEVSRSSTNLEVALVLDITGSMRGQKLLDLKAAAKDLLDLVVSTNQSPYYSKAALVPFEIGVNVGGYASNLRGTPPTPLTMTGASWYTGSVRNISGIAKTNPVRVTSTSHGFTNGDVVWITGVNGMTQLNNRAYVIVGVQTNSFQLQGVNGTSYYSYISGGTARKCVVSDCSLQITTSGGTLTNGAEVYFSGVNGMIELNGNSYTVANAASGRFTLSGINGPSFGTYNSGGSVYCQTLGCQYYRFTDANGDREMFEISACVSERTGANAYTDVAPSSSPVGQLYLEDINDCPSTAIVPLSSDRTSLKATVDGLTDGGSTAGQIGAAWGWYMLSPNFGYLWPSASQPAAYTQADVLKVMVFMTDGDFNTAYCNGVLSDDSMGYDSRQINCNATNGDPTAQAQAICTAAKAKGVIIYTVGFQVGAGSAAETFIKGCATDADHVYLPTSGTLLKDAFSAIGREITKLRLSK